MKEITVKVNDKNLDRFKKTIEEINNKFAKYSYPPLVVTIVDEDMDKEYVLYKVYSEFEKSNLIGEEVYFNGVVNFMDLGKEDTRILSINNPTINRIMQTEHCVCDKCKKDIVRGKYFIFSKNVKSVESRKDFYILGSTCAKAYFPFNVESYLNGLDKVMDDLMEYDEDSLGGYSINFNYVNMETVALATNLATNGCTSIYSKLTTLNNIEYVYGLLTAKISESVKNELNTIKNSLTVDFDVHKSIENARKHFAESDITNDFNFNCNQVLKSDKVNKKYIRLVATAIYFGNVNIKKQEESYKSEYVGNEGDKFTEWKLTFDRMFSFSTQYGFTNVMKFKDEKGNSIVWYTTKSTSSISKDGKDLKEGDLVTLKGTIKGHKEYGNEKQTLIKNCRKSK